MLYANLPPSWAVSSLPPSLASPRSSPSSWLLPPWSAAASWLSSYPRLRRKSSLEKPKLPKPTEPKQALCKYSLTVIQLGERHDPRKRGWVLHGISVWYTSPLHTPKMSFHLWVHTFFVQPKTLSNNMENMFTLYLVCPLHVELNLRNIRWHDLYHTWRALETVLPCCALIKTALFSEDCLEDLEMTKVSMFYNFIAFWTNFQVICFSIESTFVW